MVVSLDAFYRADKRGKETTAQVAAERQVGPETIELGARDTHWLHRARSIPALHATKRGQGGCRTEPPPPSAVLTSN
jgi:hypothetical protein